MIATKTLLGYSIKNGPGRNDLIHAFAYAEDESRKQSVPFEIVRNCTASNGERFYQAVQVHDIKITGLKYDGSSKHDFVVEGKIVICHLDKAYVSPLKCNFIACYDAITGKGNVNFLVPG